VNSLTAFDVRRWLLDGDPSIRWQVPAGSTTHLRRSSRPNGRPLPPRAGAGDCSPSKTLRGPGAEPSTAPSGPRPRTPCSCSTGWGFPPATLPPWPDVNASGMAPPTSTAASTWPRPSDNPRPASPPCSCSWPGRSASTAPGSTTRCSGCSPSSSQTEDGTARPSGADLATAPSTPPSPRSTQCTDTGPRAAKSPSATPPAFFCDHQLYRSHRYWCGRRPRVHAIPFPPQWHFDIVRGLEHFRAAGARPDPRLADAIDVIRRAQRSDGTWARQRGHPGRTWFRLEEPGPSRWATLRALRVLRWWDQPTDA